MGGNAAKSGVPSCAHCVPMCLVCRSKAAGASRAASFRASHRCGVRGRLSSGQQGTRRGYRHRQKPLKAARWLGCRRVDRHLRRLQTRPLLPTRGAAAIRRSSVGSRAEQRNAAAQESATLLAERRGGGLTTHKRASFGEKRSHCVLARRLLRCRLRCDALL